MWGRVVCWDATDVSEEHIASIFRVEENFSKNQQESRWQAPWFLAQLIFSTLKMEATYSSETSVNTQRTTRSYNPGEGTLHNHRCENVKFYIRNRPSGPIKCWKFLHNLSKYQISCSVATCLWCLQTKCRCYRYTDAFISQLATCFVPDRAIIRCFLRNTQLVTEYIRTSMRVLKL
jgi:hypothetical protein